MKKTFSVFLAALMLLTLLVPAFAADHTVTFVQPSEAYAGGYAFAKVEDGIVSFYEDPDGIFVYYTGRYMTLDDIYENYWDQVPPERYSPFTYGETESVPDGETLVFSLITSPVYNAASATVLVNKVKLEPSADGFYRVKADRDLTIRVLEDDENGLPGLQKNLFDVAMTSDDGFVAKPLAGEGYKATPYGGDFHFRIRIKKGYSASAMTVAVVRDVPEKDYMGELDVVGNFLNRNEVLTSDGVDAEGCRLYTVKNITSNCRIVVTGVRAEKNTNILSMLLKVLRKILDFLGVHIAVVDDLTNEYKMTVDNRAPGVTYTFLSGGVANEDGSLTVTSGNSVTLQVIKSDKDQVVNVSWDTNAASADYATVWTGKRDAATGKTIFVANYNIDEVKSDVVVSIR